MPILRRVVSVASSIKRACAFSISFSISFFEFVKWKFTFLDSFSHPAKMKMKILFIGNAGSGKSHAVRQLLTGYDTIANPYVPTCGAEVHTYTNDITIWDLAGSERYSGLRDGYYMNATHCVSFGDSNYTDEVLRACPGITMKSYENIQDLRNWFEYL